MPMMMNQAQAQKNGSYPSVAAPRRSFSMNPNEMFHGSLIGYAPPPPFFSSYPPSNSSSAAVSNFYYHQQEPAHHQLAPAQPLLPLPATAPIGRPHHDSLPNYQSAPTARKPSRGARKPKKPAKRLHDPKPVAAANKVVSKSVPSFSSPPAGKEIPVLSMADESLISMLAPPPSSLPLPRFSLRPKRMMMMSSCTAEAAVNDNGPADSLRQLLRLR